MCHIHIKKKWVLDHTPEMNFFRDIHKSIQLIFVYVFVFKIIKQKQHCRKMLTSAGRNSGFQFTQQQQKAKHAEIEYTGEINRLICNLGWECACSMMHKLIPEIREIFCW